MPEQSDRSARPSWKLFTPGPVAIEEHILASGTKQPPYNRTEEFSELTHNVLRGLKSLFRLTVQSPC
jgi:aspartate aminotransferase-like enzyme